MNLEYKRTTPMVTPFHFLKTLTEGVEISQWTEITICTLPKNIFLAYALYALNMKFNMTGKGLALLIYQTKKGDKQTIQEKLKKVKQPPYIHTTYIG